MFTLPRSPFFARVTGAALLATAVALLTAERTAGQSSFSLAQVRSYPFPTGLSAGGTGSRIVWTFNENGRRNVWVAEDPVWEARRVTDYVEDDGQELTSIQLSPDGRWVAFVRGGDHGAASEAVRPVNPTFAPITSPIGLWKVPFEGGQPQLIAEDGDFPAISSRGDVAFVRGGQIWMVALGGSQPAQRVVNVRGVNGEIKWSPDGSKFAFVSSRGDHSFIGIYAGTAKPIQWIAPSTALDGSPRWSPEGSRLVFVRRPGIGGPATPLMGRFPAPWALWVGDTPTGTARQLWKSPETFRGSFQANATLEWAADDRIVFQSYMDGWQHLYSVRASGGDPLLLTPGNYNVQQARPSPDGRSVVYAANTGSDRDDIDRRHVFRVPVDGRAPAPLTEGTGLEWTPVVTGDGVNVAFIGATAQRPPLPVVMPVAGGPKRLIGESRVPPDFPTSQLVVPTRVQFRAADGTLLSAQVFEGRGSGRRPGLVYIHGGPAPQMMLGWHNSAYYSNGYSLNQYLAGRGYTVLSVNYRRTSGYGWEFEFAENSGRQGAAEAKDIRAAGEYLKSLSTIDPTRIGVFGGSYGGFLTAVALALDSDLFAAGVDTHGVHDWVAINGLRVDPWSPEANDQRRAAEVAWTSSPTAQVSTWRSPVLLISGDDDRNVPFHLTVDLAARLSAAGVTVEQMVIPDDTHAFHKNANWLRIGLATAEFFDRRLAPKAQTDSGGR